MIKNMIFDIGSVLVRFAPDDSIRNVGIPEERIPALMQATVYSPLWIELDRGVMSDDDIIEKMVEAHPELEEDIRLFFEKGKEDLVESFDYSAEWLSYYRMKGYKIYLLSNYPATYFDIHMNAGKFTFMKYVDGMVISAHIKQIKPDHDIYHTLLEKYSLNAGECVFIDDRAENIQAAREVGIHALRFTEIEETDRRLQPLLQKP